MEAATIQKNDVKESSGTVSTTTSLEGGKNMELTQVTGPSGGKDSSAAIAMIIDDQVQVLINDTVTKSQNEIREMVTTSLGPTIHTLVRESILSRLSGLDGQIRLHMMLGREEDTGKKVSAPRGRPPKDKQASPAVKRNTPRKTNQLAPPAGKDSSKVSPTRGRFLILNVVNLSAPFTDSSGRTFVRCDYSDNTQRIYTVQTIEKNQKPLAQILGAPTLKRALGK